MKGVLRLIGWALVLAGCSGKYASQGQCLQWAEEAVEENADSVYQVLEPLQTADLTGENRAHWQLLWTQIHYKRYEPLDSFSALLEKANAYYRAHRSTGVERRRYMLSEFLCAQLEQERNNAEAALTHYLYALDTPCEDSLLLFRLHFSMGALFYEQDMYPKAVESLQKACRQVPARCSDDAVSALQLLGWSYSSEELPDSAIACFEEALVLTRSLHLQERTRRLLHDLTVCHFSKGDYGRACQAAFAVPADSAADYYEQHRLLQAALCMETGRNEQALHLLKESSQAADANVRSEAFTYLEKWYRKQGRYAEAYRALECYHALDDSIAAQLKSDRLTELEYELSMDKLNCEVSRMELEKKTTRLHTVLWSVAGLFLFTVIVGVLYLMLKEHRRRLHDSLLDIARKQRQLRSYEARIAEMEHAETVDKEELESYRQMATMLRTEILEHRSADYELGNRLLQEIKSRRLIVENVSEEGWKALYCMCDSLYLKYMANLQERYPQLSDHMLHVCCLLKLGVSNSEITAFLHLQPNSLSKIKLRIKNCMKENE